MLWTWTTSSSPLISRRRHADDDPQNQVRRHVGEGALASGVPESGSGRTSNAIGNKRAQIWSVRRRQQRQRT